MKVRRERLDLLLVEHGFFETREKARRAIMAGMVLVEEQRIDKPATKVKADAAIRVRRTSRYVGRGGYKLEAALQHFGIDPGGKVCLDVGASTGGFTDCLLQHGAARVHAIDVGHSQLHWKIRNDPRVVVREKLNARYLTTEHVSEPIDLCVIDVSFISLTRILLPVAGLLNESGFVVALIKPQFELSREEVSRGGIVRDAAAHARAIQKIETYVKEEMQANWKGVIRSPIQGTDGNVEFLCCVSPGRAEIT